nr:MAG TPA: hypothetical protein [Bacteriophage sp.]
MPIMFPPLFIYISISTQYILYQILSKNVTTK